jgi:class 3 adenylate cyclase
MLSKYRGDVSSKSLEDSLKKVLDTRHEEETKFRAKHVYKWTIMFCDASRTIKKASDISEDKLQELTTEYRELITKIAEKYDPPYTASGDGPQLVICFDSSETAANAAIEIQKELKAWRYRDDGGAYFRPSIGLNAGDFVIKDDDLKQSNACNLGKRVETQASKAQIFLSDETYEELKSYSNYKIEFETEALLKNIPEPQNIYNLSWQSSTITDVVKNDDANSKNKPSSDQTDSTDEDGEGVNIAEKFMGILICDVAGSTKKFWNLGDREGNLLIEIFRKEVFLILKKYKAIHIEIREGDMIVACFSLDRPILNVMAGIEIQKNFFRRNVGLGGRNREKIESSIGLHVGNFAVSSSEIVPNPDFFTAKGMQDMAGSNDICISEEMANMIKEYSHLPLVESGETTVKGKDEPLKIFNLEWYKSSK